jgi:hypothetical protein
VLPPRMQAPDEEDSADPVAAGDEHKHTWWTRTNAATTHMESAVAFSSPPSERGHSGGILLGVKEDSLEVENWENFNFAIKATVRNKFSNYRWVVLCVYGPAQHHQSASFLQELSEICERETLPVVLGGDFNLIRNRQEKNSQNIDQSLMNMFNEFINLYKLREIARGALSILGLIIKLIRC